MPTPLVVLRLVRRRCLHPRTSDRERYHANHADDSPRMPTSCKISHPVLSYMGWPRPHDRPQSPGEPSSRLGECAARRPVEMPSRLEDPEARVGDALREGQQRQRQEYPAPHDEMRRL